MNGTINPWQGDPIERRVRMEVILKVYAYSTARNPTVKQVKAMVIAPNLVKAKLLLDVAMTQRTGLQYCSDFAHFSEVPVTIPEAYILHDGDY